MTGDTPPGELTPAGATEALRRHLGADVVCTSVERAATGNSQETWFLGITGGHTSSVVLRRSAAAGTLEWSDRGAEVAVLDAVARAGLPVPRVLGWEPDGGSLGRAYVLMERAAGHPPDLRRPDVRSSLEHDLGRWLARLHRDVVPPVSIATPPSAATATRAQLTLWTDRARASGIAPPLGAALCGWLDRHVPDDGAPAVLVWGDPGPHNVLTDDDGHVTALLDWELAHVGHPLLDLGAARWSCLGHLDRDALTEAYEAELGAEVDGTTLRWFEVLACVSRSVMLLDGVRASIDGRAHDPNVVALGTAMLSANLLRAASLAWDLSPTEVSDVGVRDVEPWPSGLRPTTPERDEVIARFLTNEVLAHVSDARVRRGIKIAAAMLLGDATTGTVTTTGVTTGTATSGRSADDERAVDPWWWFERERTGRSAHHERLGLVAGVVQARARQRPLLDLYGATTAIGGAEPSVGSGR